MQWSIVATPRPTRATDSSFNAVSCSRNGRCTAVGSFIDVAQRFPLAERLAGRKWTIQTTPRLVDPYRPHAGRFDQFKSVSCTADTACIAVGSTSVGDCGLLAERWNGTAWSTTPSMCAAELGPEERHVYGVSCASSTACTAVGSTSVEELGYEPISLRWNGRRWLVGNPSSKTEAVEDNFTEDNTFLELHKVSCISAKTCIAVGSRGLVERVNGTTRSIQRAPRTRGLYYTGVSCTSASSCVAVANNARGATTLVLGARRPSIPTG